MKKSSIPHNSPTREYWENDIETVVNGRVVELYWKKENIRLSSPPWYSTPDMEAIAKLSPNLKLHGKRGFSVGTYHEFLLSHRYFGDDFYDDDTCSFKIGTVELSLGSISPLAYLLWDALEYDYIHGEIIMWTSMRIRKCSLADLEPVLLMGVDMLSKKTKGFISIASLEVKDADFEETANPRKTKIASKQTFPKDVVPLRLLYLGERELEMNTAFLQFYRVIEYYAHERLVKEIGDARRKKVSDKEFYGQTYKLFKQRDDEAIIAIVNRIPCKRAIAFAMRNKLIQSPKASEVARNLYKFRNSVVHAKDDYRAGIVTISPIDDEPPETRAWRAIAKTLALSAVKKFSGRGR